MRKLRFFCLCLCLVFSRIDLATASTRVHVETVLGNFELELYEDKAPLTVENFLAYVRRGDFDSTFIHRSVPGFVIQGGGYKLIDGGVVPVATQAPIKNEFQLSNVRGTLAMAKLGGDPDSATSQWFINLADNSASLDTTNGGYTVFGKVLGNGMDVIDQIAALPIYAAQPPFGELPVIGYGGSGALQPENYVIVSKVVIRPHLVPVPARLDFPSTAAGDVSTLSLQVRNEGMEPLSIGTVGGGLEAPFSIVSDGCSSVVLAPDGDCEITVQFAPAVDGDFQGMLELPSSDPGEPLRHVALAGVGGAAGDSAPVIDVPPGLDFGAAIVGSPWVFRDLEIRNAGASDLSIEKIRLEGPPDHDFAISTVCKLLAPGESCTVQATFRPDAEGPQSARVVIVSNDPVQPETVVHLEGEGRASWSRADLELEGGTAEFITYGYTMLRRVRGAGLDVVPVSPPESRFDLGLFDLEMVLPPGVSETAVGIVLPEGAAPTTYYKYGPTPDNPEPHWYEFLWDGETGAVIEGNRIMLRFVDGKRGDDDLEANGVISDPGGPFFGDMVASEETAAESGTSGGGCVLRGRVEGPGWPLEWVIVLAFTLCLRLRQA